VSTTTVVCRPLKFTPADYRHLKKTFRDHAPHPELDRGHTDTGLPYVSVTHPWWEVPACITRSERGWQMHRGGATV
jgi:hypothetical protein